MHPITLHKKIPLLPPLGIFTLIFAVTLITAYLYSPVIRTSAEESGSVSTSSKLSANIRTSISVSSPQDLLLSLTPTPEGTFNSNSLNIKTNTNSNTGYELYLSSIDEQTSLSHLTPPSSPPTTIPSISTNTTVSSFPLNSWGYSLDNVNYQPIAKLSSPTLIRNVHTFPTTSSDINTIIHFGTKLNTTLPSGFYAKTVQISAIAHVPEDTRTIFDIEDMQEISPKICSNTTTPTKGATTITNTHTTDNTKVPRTTLKDQRDNKNYLISKLADGNCWMSQNLELDLDPSTPLTSTTTDLNTKDSWVPERKTQVKADGNVIWTLENKARSYHPSGTEAYYQNGINHATIPSQSDGSTEWEKAGNYYTWYTATSGSGLKGLANTVINDSLCPRGWKLPDNDGNKSFYNLLDNVYQIPHNNTSLHRLTQSPFHFPYTGLYAHNTGYLDYYSTNGYYWSNKTTTDGSEVYNLAFYTSTNFIYNAQAKNQTWGFSVRCLAR